MKSRLVCEDCKSTFFNKYTHSIGSVGGDIAICPICGSVKLYEDISPKGTQILKDTINNEHQSQTICSDIINYINALYASEPNRSWDDVFELFKIQYLIDEELTVPYQVGVNRISDACLALRILGWRAILAIGPDNRVFLKQVFRKNKIDI